jgi:hypothetical protein
MIAKDDDRWVGRKPKEEPGEPTRRLSVDVPLGLHTRFKIACASQHVNMADALRDAIEERTRALETSRGSVAG